MTINLSFPEELNDLKPRITVVGVGGAGGNAVNNMVRSALAGVEFVACNTDAQALQLSLADHKIQLGQTTTRGLGAGSRPDIGRAAAEEALEEIMEYLKGCNMVFITAGMGGGTGTGAAPIIAKAARENDILTVGVVTKPFHFEGTNRMRLAESGIKELQKFVDTLLIIPNQNLFRVANEQTTLAEAFKMADDVLHAGVRGVTDLMVMPGLINLDFADIRTVMGEMGKAMMGTGEAAGEKRSIEAAEAAISNPLLDDVSMRGAKGVLINITGGRDMTLFEVDEAANRIREEVDPESNIIFGSTFDEKLEGRMRISVVATGIDAEISRMANQAIDAVQPAEPRRTAQIIGLPTLGGAAPEPSADPVSPPSAEHEAPIPPLFGTPKQDASSEIPSFASVINGAVRETSPRIKDHGFVVPPPVAPIGPRGQGEPEPMATARMMKAHQRAMPPPPAPSLFRRLIGGGRAQPVPPLQRLQNHNAARPPETAAASPEREAPPTPVEGDYLDIPAFLRRQAN